MTQKTLYQAANPPSELVRSNSSTDSGFLSRSGLLSSLLSDLWGLVWVNSINYVISVVLDLIGVDSGHPGLVFYFTPIKASK